MTDQTRDKRYNLTGVIAGLKTGTTTDGKPWARFKLQRNGKKQVSCAAFEDKAAALTDAFSEGATVKLFGFYRSVTFNAPDTGRDVTYREFAVMWSGVPGRREDADQAENGTDTAAQATPAAAEPAPADATTASGETDVEISAIEERRQELDGSMTKAKLMVYAEENFSYELNSKLNKPEMIDLIIKLETGQTIEAA
ncbi:hypothetical protein CKO28_02815 [Rhodovibrio sodomensis]|uniref:Single-stranded DNA-binding protein n=1 Tax=Rhodovibrio sodomensis TaxID=1088 RepID=A0ABS1D9S9_9PROT|nr:hypothetical protein [Rhodovibrio sodomensis]MBK1666974.1 hypothetical protein [Rhodovibrio sodomensis]